MRRQNLTAMNPAEESSSAAPNRERATRKLLRNGVVGAVLGILLQGAIGLVYFTLGGTAFYDRLDGAIYVINGPCARLIPYLEGIGIVPKHSGLAVVAVFFLYSALIGFVVGVVLGELLSRARGRRGRFGKGPNAT